MIRKQFFEEEKVTDEKIEKLRQELKIFLPDSFLQYNDKEVILHILKADSNNTFEKGYVENIFEIAYNKCIKEIPPTIKKDSEYLYKELSIKYDDLISRIEALEKKQKL